MPPMKTLFFNGNILMKLTLLTEEKPDDTNKFNGIFRYLQRKNDIIQSQTVIVNQSSQFPFTNTGGDEVHSAECLVYDVNRTGWASVSEPNQYFEFYFPKHYIELSSYAFKATANDDDIPRNWLITCINNNEIVKLDEKQNNKELCNGMTGNGKSYFCGFYDIKVFETNNQKLCQRIRFQQTGENSSNQEFFVLSGVELFGKLFQNSFFTCKFQIYHQVFHTLLFTIFIK